MGDSEVKDWALLVRATDRPGVLARISLLCQRFGVNLDFVRFGSEPSRVASGILVLRGAQGVVEKLAGKVGGLVDVLGVEVMDLDATGDMSTTGAVPAAATPRDLDDLMDALAQHLPAYAKRLTERLRGFRVTADLSDSSPAITREAACHIERLEAENLLLSRIAGSRSSDSSNRVSV